jgi:hypothetical protein
MADEWKLSVLQMTLEEVRSERERLKRDFDTQYASSGLRQASRCYLFIIMMRSHNGALLRA